MKTCKASDCDRTVWAKGFCGTHYHRFRRTGSEQACIQIQPRNGAALKWLKEHVNHIGDECLTWPFSRLDSGYPCISKYEGTIIAHRVMCRLAHGEPPLGKPQTSHKCGNGHLACINPNHLRWASVKENEADKKLHGTDPIGERNPNHKLTIDKVAMIRSIHATGKCGYRKLANQFGVTKSTIFRVIKEISWSVAA